MTRPLRQKHRLIVCFLAVLLPCALAIGVVARRPIPRMTFALPQMAPANMAVGDRADVSPANVRPKINRVYEP
jgi:hypothetical protein